jgi:CopG family nickel-responsive transcriptional regulator
MSSVVRFSVSLEPELLDRFDRYREEGRFATRSEAVRRLVQDAVTARDCAREGVVVAATLTLVYDHHKTGLTDKLLEAQHDYPDMVLASTHVHLDHDTCLEVIFLRGKAEAVLQMADGLRGLKGIFKGQLVFAAPSL